MDTLMQSWKKVSKQINFEEKIVIKTKTDWILMNSAFDILINLAKTQEPPELFSIV